MRDARLACRSVSTDELQRVIAEVQQQEAAGAIEPLPEDDTPTRILETDPQPGQIVDRKEYPVFGATELTLNNGMRVSRLVLAQCLVTCCARKALNKRVSEIRLGPGQIEDRKE